MSELIIPGDGPAAGRAVKDAKDASRGTRRNLALLRARRFPTSPRSVLKGIVGAPRRPRYKLTDEQRQQLEEALQEGIDRNLEEFQKLPER